MLLGLREVQLFIPRPLHTRFSSFVYSFCRTRRKPRRIPPSMFLLSFRPLLLFSRSPLRLPKINRQKLAVFLHFFLSLPLLFHCFFPRILSILLLFPLRSLPRDNQIIRAVPLMKNTCIRISSTRRYFIERDKRVVVNSFVPTSK